MRKLLPSRTDEIDLDLYSRLLVCTDSTGREEKKASPAIITEQWENKQLALAGMTSGYGAEGEEEEEEEDLELERDEISQDLGSMVQVMGCSDFLLNSSSSSLYTP